MEIVQKAGAVVLSQKDPSLVALLYRSARDDWSFPKGRVEASESVADTARREVMEETGLLVRFIGDELPSMEYDHSNGDHIVTHMFLTQSEDDAALKVEFECDKIVWIHYKEIVDRLSHANAKQYYVSVLTRIEERINALRPKIH